MKFIVIFFLASFSLFGQTWQNVSEISENTFVHSIFYPSSDQDRIIVIADSIPIDKDLKLIFPSYFALLNGYGYFESIDGGKTFPNQKMSGTKMFLSMTESKDDPNIWIASTIDKNISSIGISSDKGETWDFDISECELSSKILNFITTENEILAGAVSTGFGVINGGTNFNTCANNDTLNVSVRDIRYFNNKIYLASDDNAKSGVYFSDDLGLSWRKDQSGLSGIRVNAVCPSPEYEFYKAVLCGGDKYQTDKYVGAGIFYSSDNGQTWKQQGAAGSIIYDIKYHPKDPLFILAAAGKDGIFVSTNGGLNWAQNNESLPEDADVRYISFPNKEKSNSGYEVYIGLYAKGLWKTTDFNPVLSSVETKSSNEMKVMPNPIGSNFDIYVNSDINSKATIDIFSIEGERLFSREIMLSNGENYINIPDFNYSAGIYMLNLNTGNSIKTMKLIKD